MPATIAFTCPHCGLQTEVAATYAGQTGPCAGCRKPVTVPEIADLERVRPTHAGRLLRGAMTVFAILAILAAGTTIFSLIFVAAFRPHALPLPGVIAPPPPECDGNLRQIGQALLAYAADHDGQLPPAYVADAHGKPMLSWRALIVPYLQEERIAVQIDITKPWDSPENATARQRIPQAFACPRDTAGENRETSYMVIRGPTLLFYDAEPRTLDEITDSKRDTIMVVEVARSGIHWMEPVDLDVESLDWQINSPNGMGSNHRVDGFHVLFADGTVRHLGEFVPIEELQAMATIRGGESVAPQEWVDDGTSYSY